MKTLNFILSVTILTIVFVPSLNADDTRYLEAMQKSIQSVYKAQSIADLQSAANSLERIAAAEKDKWEPYYYTSFAYIMMANKEADGSKKDAYLDVATTSIDKALSINNDESEIVAMAGFVQMIRVTVDPGTRGPQYAGLAMQTFGKAAAMNPENPRALALMAQMQFGTAKFFGSPTTEACTTLNSALEKFDSFKPASPLSPQWGREMALGLKKECN